MDIASIYNAFSIDTHGVFRRALALASSPGTVHLADLLRALIEGCPALCRQAVPALSEATAAASLDSYADAGHASGGHPEATRRRFPLTNSPSVRQALSRAAALAAMQTSPHPIDPACLLVAILEDPSGELASWRHLWGASAARAASSSTTATRAHLPRSLRAWLGVLRTEPQASRLQQ